jgi:hypothetical protein
MPTTDKNTFDAFVAARCTGSMISEPRTERDVEYSYECFDDADGNEVAFITYRAGEEPTYFIRDEEGA